MTTFDNDTCYGLFFPPSKTMIKDAERIRVGEMTLKALKQVGLLSSILIQNTQPGDTTKLWLDTSTDPDILKYYNGSAWVAASSDESFKRLFTSALLSGTLTASSISDFTEATQDVVGSFLTDSSTINFTYDDSGNLVSANVISGSLSAGDIAGLGTLATQSGTFSGTHSGTSSGTNTGDQTITLTGEVSGSGTGSFSTTISNAAVISKVITGFTSGAGTLAATDTILEAIQKLDGNIVAAGGSPAASSVTFTPAGGVASTNVQAAIVELDTEKAAASHTHAQSDITNLTSDLAAKAPLANATMTGVTNISEVLKMGGVQVQAAIGSNTNNWAITNIDTKSFIRISASVANIDVTGIAAPTNTNTIYHFFNEGSFGINFKAASGSSSAANRFNMTNDFFLPPNTGVTMMYSATTSNWIVISERGLRLVVTRVTASGNWTKTQSLAFADIYGIGGGGGAGSASSGNGGSTSFGAHGTCTGGNGSNGVGMAAPGDGSSAADYYFRGEAGIGLPTTTGAKGGKGATPYGNNGGQTTATSSSLAGSFPGGGAAYSGAAGVNAGGGGGGGFYTRRTAAQLGATETVTIGAGGTAGTSGAAGARGEVWVFEYHFA